MLIVIGGMIGLGKTSLGEFLAKDLDAKMYYESVNDNPILPLYYTATPKEIEEKRYPFLLQLYFLNSRFETIKDAANNSKKGFSVIDRSIYEDWYFAKINYDLGRMNDLEFSIYKKLLDNMMAEIEEIPQKAPDLMVYLTGSFETVLKRINSRGREFELDPELVSYYKTLWNGYSDWLKNFYKASDVITIDMDKYDVVNSLEDRNEVLNIIKEKLNKVKKSLK
ncbi:deoxynucleoside kinase [Haploplasma axanthum]|uniref:Deoxyguanosine kinase n=1 Tax=Haploplasma axanthum TaxID=29552 RepID=A0A449BDV2_HAPAX|nr:deoxynucleoside kinase [Haploplasma axanthum]VEU80634.1 Deoxyguanosine kinase [Haploplasma axanthum]